LPSPQFIFNSCEVVHRCPTKNMLGSRNWRRSRAILQRATICQLGMSPPQPLASGGAHHLDTAPVVSPRASATFLGPPRETTIDLAGSMR
jgi:hypothetical protein